jgi:ubiquinone/menaquinone biosynthesis C-methylase UbiE
MLPASLTGAKFLDLGCGFGWASRWARKRGAAEVLGVDLSENMLAKAREFPADGGIAYLGLISIASSWHQTRLTLPSALSLSTI